MGQILTGSFQGSPSFGVRKESPQSCGRHQHLKNEPRQTRDKKSPSADEMILNGTSEARRSWMWGRGLGMRFARVTAVRWIPVKFSVCGNRNFCPGFSGQMTQCTDGRGFQIHRHGRVGTGLFNLQTSSSNLVAHWVSRCESQAWFGAGDKKPSSLWQWAEHLWSFFAPIFSRDWIPT